MRKRKNDLETSLFNHRLDKGRDARAYTVGLFDGTAAIIMPGGLGAGDCGQNTPNEFNP